MERLFSSSLVALVSLSSPRKLKVCHFKRNTEICNYSYSNTILAVKLNRLRLVVCLEESLYIHNIRDMKLLHTIRNTPANREGLCALSACIDKCYLAYPGHSAAGELQLFDACALVNKITIAAHDNPLAALAFDPMGEKIATASEKVRPLLTNGDFMADDCVFEGDGDSSSRCGKRAVTLRVSSRICSLCQHLLLILLRGRPLSLCVQ